MAGSFMYFVGLSSNFIIISRLVAGKYALNFHLTTKKLIINFYKALVWA